MITNAEWATKALRAMLKRCFRNAIAEASRESDEALAAELRERAIKAGWLL